jgi:hypothetical protein
MFLNEKTRQIFTRLKKRSHSITINKVDLIPSSAGDVFRVNVKLARLPETR